MRVLQTELHVKAQDLLGPFVRNVEPGTIRVSNVPLLLLCIFLMCIKNRNDMWVYKGVHAFRCLSLPLPLPPPLSLALSLSLSLYRRMHLDVCVCVFVCLSVCLKCHERVKSQNHFWIFLVVPSFFQRRPGPTQPRHAPRSWSKANP